MPKNYLDVSVLEAAKQRVKYTFDNFDKIYVSFSGGKDSTVMVHLVAGEARKRNTKFGLFFVDLEAQYKATIEHIKNIYKEYEDCIIPFWCSLPLHLSNSVSVYEPRWICWEPEKKDIWVRHPDKLSITDHEYFPFYRYPMEFEEFTPEFGEWYSNNGKIKTACLVGIRADESLHRYATIKNENKTTYKNKQWTTLVSNNLYNVYPIYDWQTSDIWIYHGKYYKSHNKIYDLMHKAGLSIHQQRLCQPYGYDQRKGLYLYHVLEPETWSKLLMRVNGANSGAEFVKYSGNVSGQIKITLPKGHTWKSFAELILKSMPEKLADHYDDKICQFISWWESKGGWFDENGKWVFCTGSYGQSIADYADPKMEAKRKIPSWRRICKTLLRNDYWCKGLSFSQTDSHSYKKYKEYMKKRKLKIGWTTLWI
jgi:predicted phosphoadenosine phosphosulfate sulfurtransferase